MNLKIVLLILFATNILISDEIDSSFSTSYVDSIDYSQLSFDKKIIVSSIKKWQNYSYNNEKLNCQYYPSCSNYFAKSIINNHNTYIGIIKGSDRLIRCNPFAKDYHSDITYNRKYFKDGRMIDNVNPIINPNSPINSIYSLLFSIIPGAGRAYSGRPIDGLISFSAIVLLSQFSYTQHKNENYYLSVPGTMIFLTFWLSDFYGAYRSSKIAK